MDIQLFWVCRGGGNAVTGPCEREASGPETAEGAVMTEREEVTQGSSASQGLRRPRAEKAGRRAPLPGGSRGNQLAASLAPEIRCSLRLWVLREQMGVFYVAKLVAWPVPTPGPLLYLSPPC